MNLNSNIADLWHLTDGPAGITPNFDLLRILSDAYVEAGDETWQRLLIWAANEERWPDNRHTHHNHLQFSWWWFNFDTSAHQPGELKHSVLPMQFGEFKFDRLERDTFLWYPSVAGCFSVLKAAWDRFPLTLQDDLLTIKADKSEF